MSKPPEPPECRLICSLCGFAAPKSKYKHICLTGIVLTLLILIVSVVPIAFLIFKIIESITP